MSNLTTSALAALEGAERDADGFNGRFFFDPERGDIGYIAKACDERRCDCGRKLNADGDQDCSHSLSDWEGEEHLCEPIANLLNFAISLAPSLVRQLVARVEELEKENEWMRKRFDEHHPARGSRPDDLTVREERLDDLGAEIEKLKLDLSDPHTRSVWEACQRAREEVASWPAWKRGATKETP